MANEAVLLVETHAPISMACDDSEGIEKGAFLILSGANTVTTHGANDEAIIAGIAAGEKIANDGNTHIRVYTGGIFLVTANEAITTLGMALAMDGAANKVKEADATCVGSKSVGRTLETCNAQNDLIRMQLIPGFNNNAYA